MSVLVSVLIVLAVFVATAWLLGIPWFLWGNRKDMRGLDFWGWVILLFLAFWWPVTVGLTKAAGR